MNDFTQIGNVYHAEIVYQYSFEEIDALVFGFLDENYFLSAESERTLLTTRSVRYQIHSHKFGGWLTVSASVNNGCRVVISNDFPSTRPERAAAAKKILDDFVTHYKTHINRLLKASLTTLPPPPAAESAPPVANPLQTRRKTVLRMKGEKFSRKDIAKEIKGQKYDVDNDVKYLKKQGKL